MGMPVGAGAAAEGGSRDSSSVCVCAYIYTYIHIHACRGGCGSGRREEGLYRAQAPGILPVG